MPYLGNSHIAGDQINNFKVLDDISSHTSTFDGSASGVVSISDNTIRIPEHRFVQGQRVTYNNGGGGNIGNLSSGTAYYIIKDTNNTIKLATSLSNANNSTAINLSVLGSGSSHTLNVAFDGVNTKFKITHNGGTSGRINNATQLSLAINNVIQRPNQNAITFTEGFAIEDQHKIVFKVAPVSSDIFWGSILANTLPTFDISDNKIDNFTGDGSTTEFNLSNIPASNKSIMVTINGVLQHPSDGSTSRSYTLLANILQFTAAPGNGDEIQVRHIGFAGASTSDVTGFYGRTGNVVLTSNDHITTGNINAGVVTATTFVGNLTGNVSGNLTVGGVLTYEDVTNVDSIGIITARSGFKVLAGGANVVGVITARTNIHLEDYIHHLGDLTTKIGFPAANSVTLEAGGAARVRIINTQTKIGPDADSAITSTNYEFQISGYSTGNCFALSLKHGTSGVGKNLRQAFFFKNDGGTAVDLARFQATCTANGAGSESGDLAFYTTNAGTSGERLRIESDGNLTIPGNSSVKDISYGDGSTTGYFRSSTNVNRASANQSIHMQQFRWNNTKVAEFKVITGDDTTNKDNAHIVFETANSGTTAERLRITSGGEVSVGTDTPYTTGAVSKHKFTIAGDDVLGIGRANNDMFYVRREYEAGKYTFQTINGGNAGALLLQPFGGRVNIGSNITPTQGTFFVGVQTSSSNYNTEPTVRFAIEGASSPHGDASAVHIGQRAGGSADPAIIFHRRSGDVAWKSWSARIHQGDLDSIKFGLAPATSPGSHAYTEEMIIKRAAGVGINTDKFYDSSTRLEVRGRINTVGSASTGSLNSGNGTVVNVGSLSPHNLQLITGNSTRMVLENGTGTAVTLKSSGEMGVNTNAPVEKLGISGNMRFVNPNGTTSRITALPSGTYSTGTSGGAAICFQRIADGGGGSDEIFFETHWQGNRHGESCRINKFGNLAFPSGQGIDFSATGNSSGSMSSELLDDYEEGSWTPQYQNGSGSITVNGSYSIQFGRYIKIGKMVYVEGALRANVSNNSNGTYDIGGLPFTVSNDTDSGGVLQCKEQNSWTVAPDHFSPMKNTTAARARVGLYNGAASYTNGNTSHFNSGSTNNNRIYFSGSYIAA